MAWTVVHVTYTRPEADLIGAVLRGEGIDVFIAADDAGGMGPELAFSNGVEIRVPEGDAARARETLRRGGTVR